MRVRTSDQLDLDGDRQIEGEREIPVVDSSVGLATTDETEDGERCSKSDSYEDNIVDGFIENEKTAEKKA